MVRAMCDGGHYAVSLAEESDWVPNVSATAGPVVIGGRQRRAARLAEVPVPQRTPVIRAYLLRRGRHPGSAAVAREARYYFGVSPEVSLEEIAGVAEHYPVFRIQYAGGWSARPVSAAVADVAADRAGQSRRRAAHPPASCGRRRDRRAGDARSPVRSRSGYALHARPGLGAGTGPFRTRAGRRKLHWQALAMTGAVRAVRHPSAGAARGTALNVPVSGHHRLLVVRADRSAPARPRGRTRERSTASSWRQ
jgi:hypothetical protein